MLATNDTAPDPAPRAEGAARPSLVGCTRAQLGEAQQLVVAPEPETRMRVGQLWHWIHQQGVRDFDRMPNVSKLLRQKPAGSFNAGCATPVRTAPGRDILAACGQLKSETEKLLRLM